LPARHCHQPVGIVQHKMRPLIAGHASDKGQDRHGGVEGRSARLADGGDQLCLRLGMGGPNIFIGEQVGAPEQFWFMRPVRAEPAEQPRERRMRPNSLDARRW
jgi:hypothetical protein